MVGHSMGIEFLARYQKPKSGVFFEPGIWVGVNTLRARATEQLHVKMHLESVGLLFAGGLQLGKSTHVKVGVLGERVAYSMVDIVTATHFSLGHSGFADHLYSRNFVPAVVLGFGGVPGKSRIVELFLECHQYLLSYFTEPFKIDALGSQQPPVFNSKALSTVFLGGISFKFVNARKRVEG